MKNSRRLFHYASLVICGIFGLSLQNTAEKPPLAEKPAIEKKIEATGSDQRTNPVDSKKAQFAGKIVVIPVGSEEIEDDERFRDFRVLLKEIDKSKASAVIFEIDGANVRDWSINERFLSEIESLKTPKYSFINKSGTESGTFIALATKEIYMAPGGIIGGAGLWPKSLENEEAQKRYIAQFISLMKVKARSLASQNKHRVEIVEAFIDSEVEVKIGDKVISKKGEILTLTAEEAVQTMPDGKPLIAAGIVKSIDEMVEKIGLSGEIEKVDAEAFVKKRNRDRLNQKTSKKTRKDRQEAENDDSLFSKRSGENMKGKIVVLEVGLDTLSSGEASFLHMDRIVKKAELDGAEAVIFDMDTPGGYAWYTQGLVLNSLQNLTIPTYSFVNPRAESAGAIIAIGTDTIYMRPAATIGSALVVGGGGGDLGESMTDKVTKEIMQMVENVAIIKGHNPDIAKAFVSKDTRVEIDGTVVHDGDGVLNLNSIRATEIIGGKPVLAKGIAIDLEDLVEQEGLTGEIVKAEALGMEAIAGWVQKFSFLLIMVGLAGAYMEMKAPGFGAPGLISVLCFSIFFFGNHMAGNLAGYELAVVFVIGIILIIVEIFLFPGLIFPALIGTLMVLGSLVFAMGDRVDFQWKMDGKPGALPWEDLFSGAMMNLAIALIGVGLILWWAMRFLPETRFGSWMILKESIAGGASIGERDEETGIAESYVGLEGIAESDLRPAGKGRFDRKFLDITADGEFIETGTALKIIKQEGSRIVVERA
ncbi:MAG: NfeD family protein [Verrucomicrobiales bacterium]